MTTVVTACFGGFDRLWPQVGQNIPVEWIAITDDPDLVAPAPWRKVVRPPDFVTPRMSAKVFKLLPGITGDRDVIWVDANTQITSRTFAREALHARRDGLAAFKHPRRDCIYEEAQASIGAESQRGKYEGMPILEQVESYRAEGHPEHGGLFACGTLAWDALDEAAVHVGGAWLQECIRWTPQDQLSLPVVCRRAGITPGVFPLAQIERRQSRWLSNRWQRIHPHRMLVP